MAMAVSAKTRDLVTGLDIAMDALRKKTKR